MSELRYPMYDTAFFTNAAGGISTLFSNPQGSNSTLTKSVTNSRGAGQFPQNEAFAADWLGIFLDEIPLVGDIQKVWVDSYLEFRVNDETVMLSPLRMLAALNAFGGHFGQAAAADLAAVGLMGNGLPLDIPIIIPGGTAFQVLVFQGTALSAAAQSVRFVMNGILTRS